MLTMSSVDSQIVAARDQDVSKDVLNNFCALERA